jgi:hypothetical protein
MTHCGEKLPIAGEFCVGPLQHAKAVQPDVDRVLVSSSVWHCCSEDFRDGSDCDAWLHVIAKCFIR